MSNTPAEPPGDDVVSKHGKRFVVIVFCILAGDALPTIIQSGISPNEKFYTIVVVTLPYTGALALVFLFWAKTTSNGYAVLMGSGLILLAGFWAGAMVHWGISDAEAALVDQQLLAVNHPVHQSQVVGPRAMMNDLGVLLTFYWNKFGAPLFVGGTLAAVVIAWNMVKWTEKTTENRSPA